MGLNEADPVYWDLEKKPNFDNLPSMGFTGLRTNRSVLASLSGLRVR